MQRLLIAVLGWSYVTAVQAFDQPVWCSKAKTAAEQAVCADENLSKRFRDLDTLWGIYKEQQTDKSKVDVTEVYLQNWNKTYMQPCEGNKACLNAAVQLAVESAFIYANKTCEGDKPKEVAELPKPESIQDVKVKKSDASCIEAKGFIGSDIFSSDEQVATLQALMAKSPDCDRYGITWSLMAASIKVGTVLVYDLSEKPESLYRVQFLDLTEQVAKPTFNYIKLSPAPRDKMLKDEPADGFDPPIVEDKGHELPQFSPETVEFFKNQLIPTIE